MSKRANGTMRKRGGVWRLRYYVAGARYEESAGTGDEREARALLAQRRREIADGTWRPPSQRREGSASSTLRGFSTVWLDQRRKAGVLTVENEAARFRDYILPALGDRTLGSITRSDVVALVQRVSTTTSAATKKRLAPRTVLHVYSALRTLFADAVVDEVVPVSPCTLRTRRGELPLKRDADPRWRDAAAYTRDEAISLISSSDVPLDRRVYYGFMLLAGLRSGETAGLRWRDFDRETTPLGRLLVATQAEGLEVRETKTQLPRRVPVHPTLAVLLGEWRSRGFAMLFGRPPEPGDFIVPSRAGLTYARGNKGRERLVDDLRRLKLRVEGRRRHAMRATFRSLAIESGANPTILDLVMWARPLDVRAGYERFPWAALCAEVAKLELRVAKLADVIPLRRAVGDGGGNGGTDGPRPRRPGKNRPEKIGAAGFEALTRLETLEERRQRVHLGVPRRGLKMRLGARTRCNP